MTIYNVIYKLLKQKKINKQQFRTYKGQLISGDVKGCVVGLQRKGLITYEEINRLK